MTNERLAADAAMMLDAMSEQFEGMARIQRDRAQITATATACEKRITVVVNADGILIETRFADDIADLTYDEIAAAMTEAVQAAAADAARRGNELMQPLLDRKLRLPSLSELVEGAPDLGAVIPVAPSAPITPPGSSNRESYSGTGESDRFERLDPRRSVVRDRDE
ncbi:YbaB/EbfC family nucleoid-associated protein [Nocardia mexicana]|uniref:YbaB/EbfC DNA-binding family protein n=2 Tax=Nocardia mexicana TaxID=279262 RepID=A0A370GJR0_9NOCA|nr:YbaB/EbfC family nucleoid-associated protein [Nocardia mexicana]RDI43610.1 YbaB/EbfC DNA-binding family protein [Nocardia mexicana]